MQIACSYFGNRIPRHVGSDMERLRALGFDRVVHTFCENDLRYYRRTMGEIVRISEDCGLEVLLDPWGVAGVFGGEAFSQWLVEDEELAQRGPSRRRLAGACLNHPRLLPLLRQWTEAAAEAGARTLFWDEPHWSHRGPGNPEGEICVCEYCRARLPGLPDVPPEAIASMRAEAVARLLAALAAGALELGMRSSICVLPDGVAEQPALDWNEIARLPGVVEFGTDPYWQAFGISDPAARDRFIDAQASAALEACRSAGVACMLWLQAFRVTAEGEEDLFAGSRRLLAHGPDTAAVWGFEACAHMSAIACERPAVVWRRLLELLRPEGPGAHGASAGRPSCGP
ncbi:MAG: hypothetical protein FJY75_00685 [Candidatus Eisenbacteria bacterium]|uniref:Uncharacterized protein n=1 Tax=Eiseniibacteriota bacterium TaxID=2212470 RepID=A0A937X958_UNCEI|nr:hypothetical protein [Candidatus Eisenbacteria bacterium]